MIRIFVFVTALATATLSSAFALERMPMAPGTAKILNLPQPIGEIVLGNPVIADISVISPSSVAITAKTIGITTLIISDQSGDPIRSLEVAVSPDERSVVTLYEPGAEAQLFYCVASCWSANPPDADTAQQADAIAKQYLAESIAEESRRYRPGGNGVPSGNLSSGLNDTLGLGVPIRR